MRYAGLIKEDFGNGAGVGCTLFVQGCNRHCPGCFNEETWSFDGGEEFTNEIKFEIFTELQKSYVTRFTVLGGEPLSLSNIPDVVKLLAEINVRFPSIQIWLYSSYTYEEILDSPDRIMCLPLIDVLVDGRFILEKKDVTLAFRGSSNQRVIDVKQTLQKGEIVTLYD